MNWNEVTIYTKKEALEALSSAVMEIGITSFVVEDPDELKLFLEENSDKWDMLDDTVSENISSIRPNIKLYVADDEDGGSLMNTITDAVDSLRASKDPAFDDISIKVEHIKDEDWQYNWREFFKPFTLGEKLYIRPVWEENDMEGRISILIDPGSSFGSGQHETTQMALEALEKYAPSSKHTIDIGSGSGILSAAAAKLGAEKVTAVDIDENAVIATKECAVTNGVEDKITAVCGDLAETITEKADVVVANIFAGPVCKLCSGLENILEKGGVFISTGIIESRADEVRRAYEENGFAIENITNMGQWYLFVGKK